MLHKEQKFSSMQEEIEENRKLVEALRRKYKQTSSEIKDLEREHEF
jgi:septal ring factor EnvC (AmiA/AmiB activator)